MLDLPWLEEDDTHWEQAAIRARSERVVLAGGLAPDNVAPRSRRVRPWCVDASRSLEAAPGVKDPEKVNAFVAAARGT